MKYSTTLAISLDGFIAKKDGDTLWLHEIKDIGTGVYPEYYKTINVLIMGEGTYKAMINIVDNLEMEWPYKDKMAYVLTEKKFHKLDKNIVFFSGTLKKLDKILKDIKYHHGFVLGAGYVIREYIKANMLEFMILSIVPVTIGEGIRLFEKDEFSFRIDQVMESGNMVEVKYLTKV